MKKLYKILFNKFPNSQRTKKELLSYWFDHNVLKPILNVYYNYPGKVKRFLDKLFLEHIYYVQWSRDCDMFESTNASICYGRKAYIKMQEDACDWAEGPMSWNEISKEEYEEFQPDHRDRVMEAYENGNGKSIWV